MGLLEYERNTEKIASRIRVRVSHYIGEDEGGHLLSFFGNDSDVGAITAAVYEQARFRLTFPNGETQEITLGEGRCVAAAASAFTAESKGCGT
jgi:hypothetical protein